MRLEQSHREKHRCTHRCDDDGIAFIQLNSISHPKLLNSMLQGVVLCTELAIRNQSLVSLKSRFGKHAEVEVPVGAFCGHKQHRHVRVPDNAQLHSEIFRGA